VLATTNEGVVIRDYDPLSYSSLRLEVLPDSVFSVLRAVYAELGVEVKDLDEGLVDFPALRRGETVLLCWRLGEDDVGYWHTVQEGFAGRRPLPLD